MKFIILYLVHIFSCKPERYIGQVYMVNRYKAYNNKMSSWLHYKKESKHNYNTNYNDSCDYPRIEYGYKIIIQVSNKNCRFKNIPIKLINQKNLKEIEIVSLYHRSLTNKDHVLNIFINSKLQVNTIYLVDFQNTNYNIFFRLKENISNPYSDSYLGDAYDYQKFEQNDKINAKIKKKYTASEMDSCIQYYDYVKINSLYNTEKKKYLCSDSIL
ncbi:hypothetical protein TCON_1918 [Astathelohania contejeani]|uniref:Uncharacterized protein n=1 Tax=Astathelohania contejeani TaxID=164912 RepID=A0ABQ7HXF8_9MICR|nr:hypothetical protein TCON_1918 [Thelohania contejeani]